MHDDHGELRQRKQSHAGLKFNPEHMVSFVAVHLIQILEVRSDAEVFSLSAKDNNGDIVRHIMTRVE